LVFLEEQWIPFLMLLMLMTSTHLAVRDLKVS